MFLDKDNYFDRKRFLGFVWANRFEIGGELSDKQKMDFTSWIKWVPEANVGSDQTILKDSNGDVIGRIGYDEKKTASSEISSKFGVRTFISSCKF